MKPVALTIAGSDPSGGAGIQADLKTFHQFGVYGEAVITLITVQNTLSVDRVEILSADLVSQQIGAVTSDILPFAAKTGALGSIGVIEAVASAARSFTFPLVVDPVMISKHGAPLIEPSARQAVADLLLPLARLVTPNLPEAAALAGFEVAGPDQMRAAARSIFDRTGACVLVKGGHLEGDALDILFDGESFHDYRSERFATPHTHGTGCTYSAAITASLALGLTLEEAVARAKRFIIRAIRTNPGLGGGCGPVNHHAEVV
ncbi:MAG TPA: bifunctional hydroxymethylpyrimidine kinase/phosphomethylpyrimidine kinase [Bryobacteraceae bacterium]|nr:bifunctional hydroxymethylpyrimidine kinase/phosphomethylpyrimidine kinase [Bryobacteraceae bacterium]